MNWYKLQGFISNVTVACFDRYQDLYWFMAQYETGKASIKPTAQYDTRKASIDHGVNSSVLHRLHEKALQ